MKRLLIPLFVLIALGAGFYLYLANQRVDGPLTGLPVSRDIANQRPVAVTLDNFSPDARPQSGLAQASLVFETLAEGGITRFMAVYLEHEAAKIGPVRSTRQYFNSWAAGLGVIFGHDGGNVDSLQELKGLSTIYNEDNDLIHGPFYRTTDRAIPHNEYTSSAALRAYAESHGGKITGVAYSLPHKNNAPFADRAAQQSIPVNFSSSAYNVEWQFDRAADDYQRFMGGTAHIDPQTGLQLTASNVVVMQAVESAAYDPFTPGAIHFRTEGTGPLTVYQDGKAISGTWSKSSIDAPLRWLDSRGNPIQLNRGATWVEVLPQTSGG
ncbi:MAG: DUF3048 domain-containing protein [Chloroflexota bacterium]